MSVVLLFCLLAVLALGVWMVAVISLWYGRELLKRQRELTLVLLPYLHKVEQESATIKALNIDKDEPLSKYQEVTLPEQVRVTFTQKKSGK